ncbi:MAG: MATE family efflux transporter [Clostridia bacterium]|nr:MATE family efflux transporter [Clostridia bacterium]
MTNILKRKDADMTQGNIWRHLLTFAIPTAIGLLFQQLYNIVDTIVVGRFVSSEALAAVGSTTPIVNMLVGLCMGISTGAGVVISQYYGAHDTKNLSKAVNTTIAFTGIMCVFATIVGIIITDPMLKFMNTPGNVFPESHRYLTIYFAGITGLMLYNMGGSILRAVGDSTRPTYFLILSALINIALDLLFVIVLDMGVIGVAIATDIAQLISGGLILVSLTKTEGAYAIKWKEMGIDRTVLKQIFLVGMPAGIQQAITSFSNVFVQSYINAFGSAVMAGWTSYTKLDIFIIIPVQSIAMASTTFVGQNYGAKKIKRLRKGVNTAMKYSVIITVVLAAVVIVFRDILLKMFTKDAEVLFYGSTFLVWITPFYALTCMNQIYAGALRGVGKATVPMVIMLACFVGFRQIYLFVNSMLGGGYISMALGYPAGWLLCSVCMTVFYMHFMKDFEKRFEMQENSIGE